MGTIIILTGLLLAAALAVSIAMAIRSAAKRAWRFELSRVMSDALSAIARAPWFFLATVGLTSAAPTVAMFLATGAEGAAGILGPYGQGGMPSFLWFALGQFGHLLLVIATLEILDHGRVDPVRALSRAVRLLPSAMLVALLFWIAVAIGLVFFIAPGLFLMCLWFVVTPALVADRAGTFGSFERSAALTAGVRWQLFLLLVVGGIFWLVAYGMIAGLAGAFDAPVAGTITEALLTALLAMLPPAVAAAAHHSLRTHREGLRGDALEQVFA